LKEVIGCCYNYIHIIDTLKINRIYHRYLKEFVNLHKIDTSHFTKRPKTKLEESLKKGSIHLSSSDVRPYLLKNNLVKNECSVCQLPPVWNNKPLTLQVDHINGDHFDNRVENLRLICPNCHTQTDTYTGRNTAKYEKKLCTGCNGMLKNNNISGKCAKCINTEMQNGICAECNTNPRHHSYLKCKECLKKTPPPKLCKKCEKPIKRSYNTGDYHMRCHKGIEKQNSEEL